MPSPSSPPAPSIHPFTPNPLRPTTEPSPPPSPFPPAHALTPRHANADPPPSNAPTPPTQPLTPKQLRELRRLCRKTANRAQYDDRSVQVRQIASILAMGASALAPFSPAPGARLQAWVDTVRADGADWRDERMLLPAAAAELRAWDGLLKAVAAAHGGGGAAAAATPRRAKGRRAPAPGTPVTDERPRLVRADAGSGPVAFDDSGGEESAVSGESEDEGRERKKDEGGGAGCGLRAPLASLSISQNGPFIDVELPRRGLRARAPEKDNILRPRLPEKENALAARLTPAKARAALAPAPGQENAVPRDASPRDWSALRGSRN